MFESIDIEKYPFEDIPTDEECLLMSEKYASEFDDELGKMLKKEKCNPYEVGYVGRVIVKKINEKSLELSWYPNTFTRFHEVSISLPKDMIKICVSCDLHDIKPYIFVDDDWLEHLYLREYSVFALIDAIGVKEAIRDCHLSKEKLLELRNSIDELAKRHGDISFISFADSLILKSNWDVGYFHKGVKCSYRPEKILDVIKEIDCIYKKILNLDIYAALTQGSNEYYGEPLLHISNEKNHVCLNSLGVPFAELLAIESSAKRAIRKGEHLRMQLYIDEQFYLSLNLKYEFKKIKKQKYVYDAIMKPSEPNYFCSSCDELITNFESEI